MLIIGFALSLLVIVAGMKLLAQTQKESLGNMFKYVSMFVVIMGFLSLIGVGLHGAMKCCHMREHRMMMREHGMRNNDGYGMRGDCGDMMNCERDMGMMRGGNGCMMNNSNYNMGGSCKMGNDNCNMGGGNDMSSSCPMMGAGHCDMKDTVVVKKEIKK